MEDEGRRKKAPIRFGPKLLELLSKLGEIELEGVDIEVGELEIVSQQATVMAAPPKLVAPPLKKKPIEILESTLHAWFLFRCSC